MLDRLVLEIVKTEAKMIIAGTVLILLFGAISNSLINDGKAATLEDLSPDYGMGSYACTTDAKICPDGSYVGRVAPYCQFAQCAE